MKHDDLVGLLEFLRAAERLKSTHRSAFTTTGERESVAAHSWRLSLLAMLIAPAFPDVDAARLVRMCIVHDLGEALHGDIPAPEQAKRGAQKSADERRDLVTLVAPLSAPLQRDLLGLWDEYESAVTAEARLAKALDKLETILQHTQGVNPPAFDYGFNLGYARGATTGHPIVEELRAMLDAETERRMRGRVEALWSKRAHRGPMDALETATLVAGEGLQGSVGRSRRRQLTLIDRDAWESATRELGASVDPSARRANVMVRGIALANTRGRVLRLGDCRVQIGGECTPCERMDEAEPGLQDRLRPEWRAGVFAQVLTGGTVRVGDPVEWEPPTRG